MEPAPIDTAGLTRSRLEVFILRVVSPLLFWVRLKHGDQALQEMEEELAFCMARKGAFLICYPNDITVHMDIAEGNSWRRGWVEKISRPSSIVKKMEIESIDTTYLRPGHQEVRIVCVESPLLFWVQLRSVEKLYEKLQNKLQIKMAANKKLMYHQISGKTKPLA
ncbi:hypothetical protein EAG_14257 [Camponotus floridanus]|uniref:Uncharacterized protein n=1 Tax=Camponotus floridanus TaxID=104421 RepID=E2AN85_CAMFO|nr:hypothetical protein EAG_14257 [Camponotus floridanus]